MSPNEPVRINTAALEPGASLTSIQTAKYTVASTEKYKQAHEERIHHEPAGVRISNTRIMQLNPHIAGQSVVIPVANVTEAVARHYPTDARGYVVGINVLRLHIQSSP
jgi:hypothetical protein